MLTGITSIDLFQDTPLVESLVASSLRRIQAADEFICSGLPKGIQADDAKLASLWRIITTVLSIEPDELLSLVYLGMLNTVVS